VGVVLALAGCGNHPGFDAACDRCDSKGSASHAPGAAALSDPLRYLISLNAHGATSTETFTLPADTYVLVPHPMGFDAPYLLASPPSHVTFEEMLYSQPAGRIPLPSSGGWHLYRPGDVVRNISFSPWSGSSDPTQEYKSWIQDVPDQDIADVVLDAEEGVPALALVSARDSHKQIVTYRGTPRRKVKVFGPNDLRSVIQWLRAQVMTGPVVLAPFTCNDAPSASNITITIDAARTGPLPGTSTK
jgi:hypothetical protein